MKADEGCESNDRSAYDVKEGVGWQQVENHILVHIVAKVDKRQSRL
jgi:hypothetical protein